ncbi:hypothetical protein AGMMS49975_25380 [Clostridia bacterium]|nr:hypothetical protein AGMMS49975_25380 [Clostridia bacterium]
MYILMHKNIPVADISIDSAIGGISKIDAVHASERLPIGTTAPYGKDFGKPRRDLLSNWWTERSIPASRDGIREALDAMGVCSPKLLLEKCYGLSLSDHYWIRPKHSDLMWENVNFFTNDFSLDVGEILFGRMPKSEGEVNFMSPDSTSDGWLRKKWIIADGKRYLMKGGSGVYRQEPFNEVIASVIMTRIGIPHVDYTLRTERTKPYSVCENFITPNTELVTAWSVKEARRKENSDSVFAHLARVCGEMGIPGFTDAMNRMLTVDFIINNEDRHFNNFGFIRDADTLQWLGAAPIYDSGTSLWHGTNAIGQNTECKPFRSAHIEQLKLVQDLSWFDADALGAIGGEIVSILSQSPDASPERANAIAKAVEQRVALVVSNSLEKR